MLSTKDLMFKKRPAKKLVDQYIGVRYSSYQKAKAHRVGSEIHRV